MLCAHCGISEPHHAARLRSAVAAGGPQRAERSRTSRSRPVEQRLRGRCSCNDRRASKRARSCCSLSSSGSAPGDSPRVSFRRQSRHFRRVGTVGPGPPGTPGITPPPPRRARRRRLMMTHQPAGRGRRPGGLARARAPFSLARLRRCACLAARSSPGNEDSPGLPQMLNATRAPVAPTVGLRASKVRVRDACELRAAGGRQGQAKPGFAVEAGPCLTLFAPRFSSAPTRRPVAAAL